MKKLLIVLFVLAGLGLFVYIKESQSSKRLDKIMEDNTKRLDSSVVIPTRKLKRENRDLEIENNLNTGKIKRIKKCTSEQMVDAIAKKVEMEFYYQDRDLTEAEEAIIDSLTILIKSTPDY